VLLNFFPTSSRSEEERFKKCQEASSIEKMTPDYYAFGYDYFDNPDLGVGYGGYIYDGRHEENIKRICHHYQLKTGDRVLEVGCAKGFILVAFQAMGLKVAGIDISQYAISQAHPNVKDRILLCQAYELPFESDSFSMVLGKDILPHIPEHHVASAVKECMRVSKGSIFFEIPCGRTPRELEYMKHWDGTFLTIHTQQWWEDLLMSLNYPGDVHYKVLISEEVF